MSAKWVTLVAVLLLTGCQEVHEHLDGLCPLGGEDMPRSDMNATAPKCAAAKGLAGDSLICVDFNTVSSLNDPKLTGWDFTKLGGNCWTISTGRLQINNFAMFASTCGFTLPIITLSDPDKQKYNSYTLSVVHTVDVNTQNQEVSAYLGVVKQQQRIWYTTGKYPRMVTTLQIAKTDLPNGGSGTYQPLFQITSSLAGGATGWQVESIAVNGVP